MEPEDVLNAIDQILAEPAPDEQYDPASPGMDREWWRKKTTEVLESAKEKTLISAMRKVPAVGCAIQRSDHQ